MVPGGRAGCWLGCGCIGVSVAWLRATTSSHHPPWCGWKWILVSGSCGMLGGNGPVYAGAPSVRSARRSVGVFGASASWLGCVLLVGVWLVSGVCSGRGCLCLLSISAQSVLLSCGLAGCIGCWIHLSPGLPPAGWIRPDWV